MEPLEEIHACQPPVCVVGQKVNLKGQLEDIHYTKPQNLGQTLCFHYGKPLYSPHFSIIHSPIITMCFTGYGMLVDKRSFLLYCGETHSYES